jgi:hypothetical protein
MTQKEAQDKGLVTATVIYSPGISPHDCRVLKNSRLPRPQNLQCCAERPRPLGLSVLHNSIAREHIS